MFIFFKWRARKYLFATKTSTKTINLIVRNSLASLIQKEKSTQKNPTRQEKLFVKSSIAIKNSKKHQRIFLYLSMTTLNFSAKEVIPQKKIQMTPSMNILSSMPRNISRAWTIRRKKPHPWSALLNLIGILMKISMKILRVKLSKLQSFKRLLKD